MFSKHLIWCYYSCFRSTFLLQPVTRLDESIADVVAGYAGLKEVGQADPDAVAQLEGGYAKALMSSPATG